MIAGLFFFLFFIYFIFTKPVKERSRYFSLYLLTFGFFMLGRPVQILIGPHPIPLIINNIRLLLFSSVCVPSMLLATGIFSLNQTRPVRYFPYGIGFLLGCIYSVFNTLGTTASYAVFAIGDIIARDSFTPSMVPPFYAREVTMAIQIIIGISIIACTGYAIFKYKGKNTGKHIIYNKSFLFYSGVLLFGVVLILGTAIKQWWIYYLGSVVSSIILGGGIILDIKNMHLQIETVMPFIKEEVIQNIALTPLSDESVREIVDLLGEDSYYDLFMIIHLHKKPISRQKEVHRVIGNRLLHFIHEENYLVFPLTNRRIGICLILRDEKGDPQSLPMEIAECLLEELTKSLHISISIGIGRNCSSWEDLRLSYREARDALDYAIKIGKGHVVHADNIDHTIRKDTGYPYKEREAIISAARLGQWEEVEQMHSSFYTALRELTENNVDLFKMIVHELISILIDNVISIGFEKDRLFLISKEWFKELNPLNNLRWIEECTTHVVKNIVQQVQKRLNDRSNTLIQKAREYISKHFDTPLHVTDVAKEISISVSYFQQLIKKESGRTFTEYLTSLRIENAKELLVQSDLKITDIAYHVGYGDSNYFSTIFKSVTGKTPREFRNSSLTIT